MALRYPVPQFSWEQLGDGEGKVIKRMAEPQSVRFVRDANLTEFISRFKSCSDVIVDAPCGAGKSVRAPVSLLRDADTRLVIHVVPPPVLAGSQAEYVAHVNPGQPVFYVGNGQELPATTGLMVMSAVQFVWLLTLWRSRGETREYVLYFDEVQDCDWVTATLRELRTQLAGCTHFAAASATHGHGGDGEKYVSPTLPGEVKLQTYVYEDPMTWDPYVPGKPWSVDSVNRNTLCFVDDDDQAAYVKSQFEDAGYDVFRFTSRTAVETVLEVKRRVESTAGRPGAGITMFLLDYSYRFGHTFPTFSYTIDTCDVQEVVTLGDGSYEKRSRKAYMGEVMQTAYRLGRTAGHAVYCRPDYVPERKVMLVDGPDVDAAAVLFRMLGFKPPRWCGSSPFAKGDLPKGFLEAVRGPVPLRCVAGRQPWPSSKQSVLPTASTLMEYPASRGGGDDSAVLHKPGRPPSVVSTVSSGVGDTGLDVTDVSELTSVSSVVDDGGDPLGVDVASVARLKRVGNVAKAMKPTEAMFRAPMGAEVFTEETGGAELDDMLRKLAAKAEDKVMVMQLGKYYYFNGAMTAKRSYGDFGQVQRAWASAGLAAVEHADQSVRLDVASTALRAFNKASMTVSVVTLVVRSLEELVGDSAYVSSAVADAVRRLSAELDAARALGRATAHYLVEMSGYKVVEVDAWRDREESLAEELMRNVLAGCAKHEPEATTVEDYVTATRPRLAPRVTHSGVVAGSYALNLNGGLRARAARVLLRGRTATASVAWTSGGREEEDWQQTSRRLARRFG